jgi:ribonucleoside-diphosphate reductase alpha chain
MKVITRRNQTETIDLNKITERISKAIAQCFGGSDSTLDPIEISLKVCSSIHDNIHTSELDEETARICMNLGWINPDYSKLGSWIMISNHQKNVYWSFCEAMLSLKSLLTDELCYLIKQYGKDIEAMIQPERDFNLDYFGFSTLKKSYLLKTQDGIIRETPQYLFMRVALGIWGRNREKVKETYDMLSQKYATHATPTLFNSGTGGGLASCFLLGTRDSVSGIFKTVTDCAQISKWAGGIGVHISNIRCKGSYIKGTGGQANGILPMMKIYNDTARYINQSGKRNGSFAMYIEPWHGEIRTFLKAMRKHGNEDVVTRDLFFALWIPNYFMDCVIENREWYLMCPNECPGLNDVYGDAFKTLYECYISKGQYLEKVQARSIWEEICKSQVETGMPYMLYKDHINEKSNQKNIGVIRSSNLCSEIVEYSDSNEYAVCTLASICLPRFLNKVKINSPLRIVCASQDNPIAKLIRTFLDEQGIQYRIETANDNLTPVVWWNNECIGGFEACLNAFRPRMNYGLLRHTVHLLVSNLNQIIDMSFYPVNETKVSNEKHRPIGIGVQGLADVFSECWYPYASTGAKELNKLIFEAIYYFALEKSCELAKIDKPYETFQGSPLSQGQFQFNLWNVPQTSNWKWDELRTHIQKYGVRNSLLIALMPTASTSQIMGCTECFEPRTSNIFTRRTLSGEFQVVNDQLIHILNALGLWNETTRQEIIQHRGSIQSLDNCPQYIKDMFLTAWEIKKTDMINMSADRSPYVCQSQSLNFFIEDCNSNILTKIHTYAYRKGLKTGSYYIRSKPSTNADTFSIITSHSNQASAASDGSDDPDNECLMCSS